MGLGYVKLHREAEDHEVFDDPWLWKVFTWCMMRANFRDSKVQRGSFTTGRIEAADRLRASPSRVYRAFQRLETLGCVTLKSNNRFTTVTLCNYDSYQGDDEPQRTTNEQRMDSQRTASEQQMNNQKTLLEEGEESKEGKKGRRKAAVRPISQPGLPADLPPSLQSGPVHEALATWLAYKSERREFYTETGLKMLVSRAAKLVGVHGPEPVIDAMERAMAGNWTGWDHDIGKANGKSSPVITPRQRPSVVEVIAARKAAQNDPV